MRNIAAKHSTLPRVFPEPFRDGPRRRVRPAEVAEWLERRLPRLTERWLREIQGRYDAPTRGVNGLLGEFLEILSGFLPAMLGPHREQVEPLWVRASELFGEVAARRGLAAGEVIEEFQILRELVIRLLYQDPPMGGRIPLSLRDVLRLNRAIDRGVTHASVGHTDALFFALFEGSGIPDAPPTVEFMSEMRAQLEDIRWERESALGPALSTSGSREEEEG
jgi:hypothetical protein